MAYYVFNGYVPIRSIVVKADTEEQASEYVDKMVSTTDVMDLINHVAEVQVCGAEEYDECELCESCYDVDIIDLIGNE